MMMSLVSDFRPKPKLESKREVGNGSGNLNLTIDQCGCLCQRVLDITTMADIESLAVRSDVNHRFATTTVTERFVNRRPVNATSVFNMPIPKSAYIVNLTA